MGRTILASRPTAMGAALPAIPIQIAAAALPELRRGTEQVAYSQSDKEEQEYQKRCDKKRHVAQLPCSLSFTTVFEPMTPVSNANKVRALLAGSTLDNDTLFVGFGELVSETPTSATSNRDILRHLAELCRQAIARWCFVEYCPD